MAENSHIKHGFLCDVYELYDFEGTEWGEAFSGLLQAYGRQEVFSDKDLDQLERMIREMLELAHEDGWLDKEYPKFFKEAQKNYPGIRDYWETRAKSFREGRAFFAALDILPDWIKG